MTNRILLSLLLLPIVSTPLSAQSDWEYHPERTIRFAQEDTMAIAYKAALDESGNLWVISSPESFEFPNLYARALFMAEPGATVLARVDSYDREVRAPNGITAIGDDIIVTSREGFDGNDAYHPHSLVLRYPGGDPAQREKYDDNSHGDYGSWVTGGTATSDGFVYVGRSWRMTIMTVDFRPGSTDWGMTTPAAETPDGPMEPRGNFDAWGSDLIRSIALLPGGDYNDPTTPVFTSRNASMGDAGHRTGGIAMWTGGTQSDPSGYRGQRVEDIRALLDFEGEHPYGIALDRDGILYVAGTDEGRRWVKAFEITEGFAFERSDLELPASTSLDDPDPSGAPFEAPSDIVFTADGSTAYVTDKAARQVFVFTRETDVSAEIGEIPSRVALHQNYPNPFNPATRIRFELSSRDEVLLSVHNVLGREVSVLVDGIMPAGEHAITFHAGDLPSGVYFARLETTSGTKVIRMSLIK